MRIEHDEKIHIRISVFQCGIGRKAQGGASDGSKQADEHDPEGRFRAIDYPGHRSLPSLNLGARGLTCVVLLQRIARTKVGSTGNLIEVAQ